MNRSRRRALWPWMAIALALFAMPAQAQQDAGTSTSASCVEHIPPGATRPDLRETFPDRGFSGYAARLEITVVHGKGETVLPAGLEVQTGSDAARAIEAAGFVLPNPDGGAGPSVTTDASGDRATTKVSVAFVPLPKEPGRHFLVLPPVPIAVARASGDVVTVCTKSHTIAIEDPIANELDPKVRPNPAGRPQREEWVAAKYAALALLVGAILGVILAWLLRRWARRPKPVIVAPPKLPWVEALEELAALRRSNLLSNAKTDEYFDRVSDCVRKYLGGRYGFDGLESTTDEVRATLKRVRPSIVLLPEIGTFLSECDLVKFARVLPTESDCLAALDRGEMIVKSTIPANAPVAPPAAPKRGRARRNKTEKAA